MGAFVNAPRALPPGNARLDWGVADRALPGLPQTGDAALVSEFADGCLLAVADGLGHGADAASAARLAMEVLQAHAKDTVLGHMQRCHERLRSTRGVVLSLVSLCYSDNSLAWVGVGNVSGLLVRATAGETERERLLCRGGTVGAQMPQLYAGMTNISAGDTIVLHTDGLHPQAGELFTNWLQPPRRIADEMLRQWARDNDDALVLVARYQGVQT